MLANSKGKKKKLYLRWCTNLLKLIGNNIFDYDFIIHRLNINKSYQIYYFKSRNNVLDHGFNIHRLNINKSVFEAVIKHGKNNIDPIHKLTHSDINFYGGDTKCVNRRTYIISYSGYNNKFL